MGNNKNNNLLTSHAPRRIRPLRYDYRQDLVAKSDMTEKVVGSTLQKIEQAKKVTPKRQTTLRKAKKKVNKKHQYPKMRFSGGSRDEARNTFLLQEPILMHTLDSIASAYGISPKALENRFKHEGQLDLLISRRNKMLLAGDSTDLRGYALIHEPYDTSGGVSQYGFDAVGDMIKAGEVAPINEKYVIGNDGVVRGKTLADNIGLMASTLKTYRDEGIRLFPNSTPEDWDWYSVIRYNRSYNGAKDFFLNRRYSKDYDFSK